MGKGNNKKGNKEFKKPKKLKKRYWQPQSQSVRLILKKIK